MRKSMNKINKIIIILISFLFISCNVPNPPEPLEYKINYDLEYIDNFSFMQDVKIVFLTIKAVFSESGHNNTVKIRFLI